MFKTRKYLVILIVTGFLLSSPFAFANENSSRTNRMNWWDNPEVQGELGLSQEQVGELAALYENFGDNLEEVSLKKRAAYRKMITALDRDDLTDEQFNQYKEGLEAAWASQATELAERWHGIRQILTKDQWKNLANVAPKAIAAASFGVSKRSTVTLGQKPNK